MGPEIWTSSIFASTVTIAGSASVGGALDVSGKFMGPEIWTSSIFASTVTAARIITTSDARLKKDVEGVTNAMSILKGLRSVYYNWIDGSSLNPDTKELGYLAQEVEIALPAVVNTGVDSIKRVAYDRVVSLVTAAMQEQDVTFSARLDALEARMAASEAKPTCACCAAVAEEEAAAVAE